MAVDVFSKNWYRVENLKPKLKVQVDVASQLHRGERWYILRDTISGTIQRYSWQAYVLIGLMDGQHTLNGLWEGSADILEKDMPTQDEVVSLVTSLYQTDMIHLNVPTNARDLFQRKQTKNQKKMLQKAQSPLSIQIPLFDPTRLLDRLCPWLDRVLGYKLLFVYAVTVLWAAILGLQHYSGLTSNLSDRVLAAENLLLLWFLYPLIKILHELGHAYAVRYFGGQVSEVGIMFLVFFPMPYVNATESASFENKYQRILVSAAGVIVELFIAALALLLWSITEPGFLKSVLFNIVFMAGVSTLLFNGNPLLKFDAYYMLSDYLEIPNLAKKATSYWGFLFKRYLFGIKDLHTPSIDARERYWLFFYNLFSFAYRIFISITITIFVGSKYFILGVLLAVWALLQGWVIPFGKTVSKPFTEHEFKMKGRNPILMMGLALAFVWVLLFEIPLPKTVTVEGVAWVEESNRLYAAESGFISKIVVDNGQEVTPQQPIVVLKNYDLEGKTSIIKAQLSAAKAEFQSAYEDRAKYLLASEEIKRLELELKETQDNVRQAQVVSRASGQIVIAKSGELQGRYLKRGDLLGYVLSDKDTLQIKVLLPESEADQISTQLESINVRSASNRSRQYKGQLKNTMPQVTQALPSLVLSSQAGGKIIVDPSSSDTPRTVENFIELSVIADQALLNFVEERIFVQFTLKDEAIFWRFYRMVRRAFLEQFDV